MAAHYGLFNFLFFVAVLLPLLGLQSKISVHKSVSFYNETIMDAPTTASTSLESFYFWKLSFVYQRVDYQSNFKLSYPVSKSSKHGLICVALPCKVFLMDLTVHMDIEINPGPNFSVERFAKCSPSINTTSPVADSAVQHIMYSKHQLLGLRCKYSISDSLFYLLKDHQILNTRGLLAGVKSRSKLHEIPIIVNRRNMAAIPA